MKISVDFMNFYFILDHSQEDLKCAMANLVGVVLGSPPQHQHLWFHLCDIDKLKGTFITGSMVSSFICRQILAKYLNSIIWLVVHFSAN